MLFLQDGFQNRILDVDFFAPVASQPSSATVIFKTVLEHYDSDDNLINTYTIDGQTKNATFNDGIEAQTVQIRYISTR